MIDEVCEQEDQIELSPDEEEYDSDSVPLASYLNWVAKHKTRPEPQKTEANEKATSPLHYTTLSLCRASNSRDRGTVGTAASK
ncbi:hypothetical protein PoB_005875500 [Plakobranchus ocellatus]|uniref:Uncharacterized protein n=1 Tax=Plakobranchus ocellatus TaxID=259542 RepID=A0AAV4CKS8_9GAST|nr:hypothetical protein PoB_005875500 [Plakobranchus ocellatus]